MPDRKLPHDHGQEIEMHPERLPEAEDFQKAAEIFNLLNDGSRIRIFWFLCHYEECVMNISSAMNMTSPAVSHHLRQLKSRGLIISRRVGKEVYYRAADTEDAKLMHHIIEHAMKIACPDDDMI